MNRLMGDMLRNYCDTLPQKWDESLPVAEFAVNNTVNRTIGQTPFFLNYGWHPATPMVRELDVTVPSAHNFVKGLSSRLTQAKRCYEAALQCSKAYEDQGRVAVAFLPGQQVLLSTKNLKTRPGVARKLAPRWIGPFSVEQMVGTTAVRLNIPSSLKIHNVFHVSLVKPYKPDGTFSPLPVDWEETGFGLEDPAFPVERVLDYRHRKKGHKHIHEYLVKWQGFSADHNSWEPEANFSPDMLIELKALCESRKPNTPS